MVFLVPRWCNRNTHFDVFLILPSVFSIVSCSPTSVLKASSNSVSDPITEPSSVATFFILISVILKNSFSQFFSSSTTNWLFDGSI